MSDVNEDYDPKKSRTWLSVLLTMVGIAAAGVLLAVLVLFINRDDDPEPTGGQATETSPRPEESPSPEESPEESPSPEETQDPETEEPTSEPTDNGTGVAGTGTETPDANGTEDPDQLSDEELELLLLDEDEFPVEVTGFSESVGDAGFISWFEAIESPDEIDEIIEQAEQQGLSMTSAEEAMVECMRQFAEIRNLDDAHSAAADVEAALGNEHGGSVTIGIVALDTPQDTQSVWTAAAAEDCDGVASQAGGVMSVLDYGDFHGMSVHPDDAEHFTNARLTMDHGSYLIWVEAAELDDDELREILEAQAAKLH